MKRTIINGLNTNSPTVATQTVVKNIDGNIVEIQNSPRFDGPTVTVKGGNSREFWDRHPHNGNKVQMSKGAKLFGNLLENNPDEAKKIGVSAEDIKNLKAGKINHPNHTIHHKHTGKGDDCDMQLVRKEDHQQNPHRGGMLTSNQDKMREEAQKQGTFPKNKFERVCNTVGFNAHKHPAVTGTIVGVGASAILCGGYAWVCKKLDRKPKKWVFASCVVIGMALGIATHSKLDDGKVYL